MERTTTPPDTHIASLPEKIRGDIQILDALIGEVFAGHPRVMWEGRFWGGSEQRIIGYGNLTYDRPTGAVEWFMVGLAAQKGHLSLYVNAVDGDDYAVRKRAARLGKVKVGSAAINFKTVEDLDLAALTDLLEYARDQLP
jgi:hypothetical protein